jgi:hypothetical protein
MKSMTLVVAGLVGGLIVVPPSLSGSGVPQAPGPSLTSLVTEGHYDVRTFGNDSTYARGLTVRYVDGQQRFLTLTHTGLLHEFVAPAAFGELVTTTTRTWRLGGLLPLKAHHGIWFEQAKDRLWVTASDDYTNQFSPATVSLVRLDDGGTATVIGRWRLGNLPEKRVYGTCLPSPVTPDQYACGNGGYTSLVAQAGGASIGPTLYEIPEPTTRASGSSLPVRVLLDTSDSRGVRRTIPLNYFDGGDPRMNPPTPPTAPPSRSAAWLSPNRDGLGWMTWGDSYYGTGMLVPELGYVAVASLCKGKCWYMSSTLEFDGRQYEFHRWPVSSLGRNRLTRPAEMVEFTGPFGAGHATDAGPNGTTKYMWGGNSPAGNISGAVYDDTTKRIYLIGYPLGRDVYTGRMWAVKVSR